MGMKYDWFMKYQPALADILGIADSDVDMGDDAAENTLYLYSDTISNALATILGNGNTEARMRWKHTRQRMAQLRWMRPMPPV